MGRRPVINKVKDHRVLSGGREARPERVPEGIRLYRRREEAINRCTKEVMQKHQSSNLACRYRGDDKHTRAFSFTERSSKREPACKSLRQWEKTKTGQP